MPSPTELSHVESLLDLGRLADAEQRARQLLTQEPGSTEAMRLLARALVQQDKDAEAVPVCRTLVAAAPDDADGHLLLSQALPARSPDGAAVLEAREAVRLAPHAWVTHYNLGHRLMLLRHPRAADALAAANEAVRLAPHESAPHNLAGMALDELRQHDEARRAYLEALRLDPSSAAASNNLAALDVNSGRLRDAAASLTAGLAADPQERLLHHNYDAVLFKLVWRLWLALAAAGVVLGILLASGAPWAVRAVVGVALVAVYVHLTRRVTSALPAGVSLWTRGLWRRSGLQGRVSLVSLTLVSVIVLALAALPAGAAAGVALTALVLLRFLAIGWVVVSLVRLVVRR